MSEAPAPDAVFEAFCEAGLWPGLGRTLAAELASVGIDGPETVTATRLGELPKVGPKRASRLLSTWIAATPVYETAGLIVPAGLDARLAGRAVDTLGPPASRLLRDDPWALLAVFGVTIADADRLARFALPGIQRDDPRRARALVGFVLAAEARDGHTVTPRELVEGALVEYGGGPADAAVEAALEGGAVHADEDGQLGLARYYEAEESIADAIARLQATAEPIQRAKGVKPLVGELDATQLAAVDAALTQGVSVLTGGPGTGKSRTVATLVTLAEKAGKSVALAAPTGRAASGSRNSATRRP